MKTLEELQAVREKYHNQLSLRREDHTRTRVIVGMDTCGIANGAKPVLLAFSDQIQNQHLTDRFCVLQSGCIGLCKYEPIVQIEEPGKPKVTYIRMTPDKAKEVLEHHLLGGQIIDQYTLDYADHQ